MPSSIQPLNQDESGPLSTSAVRAYWQQRRYRWLAGLAVAAAIALTLLVPHDQRRLHLPNPWANELAMENFAQGKWVLTDDEVATARTQIRLAGGRLTQYIQIGPDRWAFRQAPGHSLQMVLFRALGHPRLANVTLAILAALALYPLIAAWYNEKMAFLGVTLLLWTPISLTGLHYYNMDTFAGGILPLIAGAMLLWYKTKEPQGRMAPLLLFLAGLALGWSVVVRLTNLLLLPVLGGYLLLPFVQNLGLSKKLGFFRKRKKRPRRRRPKRPGRMETPVAQRAIWFHVGAFALGCMLALSILIVYNQAIFGSTADSGYFYHSPDDEFYLWKENPVTSVPGGVPTWLAGGTIFDAVATLFTHLKLWLRPATMAWPLWPVALLGLIFLLRQRPKQPTVWFLLLWGAAVYAPYAGIVFFGVTRALAVPYNQVWGFFVPTRYLFSLSLPFVLLIVHVLNQLSSRWVMALAGVYTLGSAWLFLATLSH